MLVACKDDPGCWRVVQSMIATGRLRSWAEFPDATQERQTTCKWVIAFGSTPDCDVQVTHMAKPGRSAANTASHTLTWQGFAAESDSPTMQCCFEVQLAGQHNLLNATAAIVASSVCVVMQSMNCATAGQALSEGNSSL